MHCVSLITATLLLALAPQRAGAAPLISEAFYDAIGADNGLVFVELYGEPGTSLDGLFLEGINGANGSSGPTIALSGVFPADGIWLSRDIRDALDRAHVQLEFSEVGLGALRADRRSAHPSRRGDGRRARG